MTVYQCNKHIQANAKCMNTLEIKIKMFQSCCGAGADSGNGCLFRFNHRIFWNYTPVYDITLNSVIKAHLHSMSHKYAIHILMP
jgi:hypothetical protein